VTQKLELLKLELLWERERERGGNGKERWGTHYPHCPLYLRESHNMIY